MFFPPFSAPSAFLRDPRFSMLCGKLSDKWHFLRGWLQLSAYGAYWTREGGPFCQLCWEHDGKAITLLRATPVRQVVRAPAEQLMNAEVAFTCNYHRDVNIALPADIISFRQQLVQDGRI